MKRILAVLSPASHHIGARFDGAQKQRDRFRRVLKIGVQSHNDISSRLVKAGENRGVLSKIAAEFDDDQVRIFGLEVLKDIQRLFRPGAH